MKSVWLSFKQTLEVGWLLSQAAGRNLVDHWAAALFSVGAAFVVWYVIQDVENPRVEAVVPIETEQAIQVEYVNLSPTVTVAEARTVRVRVDAREDLVNGLRASDFQATVDLQGLEAGEAVTLPVKVTSKRDGVSVVDAVPNEVQVELVPVATKEFPVEIRQTAPLPSGFRMSEPPVIDPQFVTVSGRQELVDNVDRVEIDVNLSGHSVDFQDTYDLVARNSNGQTQLVTLSDRQATVQFKIEQVQQAREYAVTPSLTGSVSAGYVISNITIDPPVVRATASNEILEGITELLLEPIDLGGAMADVTRTVPIQAPPNVTINPAEVQVTVTIQPLLCSTSPASPCATMTVFVSPTFTGLPAGMTIGAGVYMVEVQLAGPVSALAALSLDDVHAEASLANATPGVVTVQPTVTVPTGITARAARSLQVQVVAVP